MEKRNLQRKQNPVWRTLRGGLVLTLAVFFLPAVVFGGAARAESAAQPEQTVEAEAEETAVTGAKDQSEAAESTGREEEKEGADPSLTLKVKVGGTVKTMELEEYLWGVVAAEMPAAFEPEALKAQAIAARTYTLYRMENPSPNHTKADICTDSTCCQAWISHDDRMETWSGSKGKAYAGKITPAIEETRGQAIYYRDKPIMAAFHAASAGVTKAAGEVWGKDVAYLQSVKSPETGEEVPNYYSVVTVTAKQFKTTLQKRYGKVELGKKPQKWFGKVRYDDSGLPASICIGGVDVPTSALRSLFGLRSSSVTAECDGKNVTFYVTGYGHGVGMSQYGANALAKKGKTAGEILRHYYTGVEIRSIYR